MGSINASYKSYGNKINDPYSTPFASSGLDLDAVGVINQASGLGIRDTTKVAEFTMYTNPASDVVYFSTDKETEIVIYDIFGKVAKNKIKGNQQEINVSDLKRGTYRVEITIDNIKETKRLLIK